MSKNALLQYLVSTYEKEKEALLKQKEEEEKVLESYCIKEKQSLYDAYEKKKEILINELIERYKKKYLDKERDLQIDFYNLLIERIKKIERNVLLSFRDENYVKIFEKLVKEIPTTIIWSSVFVNPLDKKLAKNFFNDAEVKENLNIIGGFIAFSDDSNIIVNNTFEKRVEKIRDELYLKILKDVNDYIQKILC